MDFLNYIIALGLVLLTVVKTAGLFIESDRSLGLLNEKFVKETRELIKTQRSKDQGNISLVAAVFTTLLSLLLLLFLTKMQLEYKEALYRKDSYLCMGHLNSKTRKYIQKMAAFNWSIRSAFIAKNTGIVSAEAEVAFRTLVLARDMVHAAYMATLLKNKYCAFPLTAGYLKNPPFKLKNALLLETNSDNTAVAREKKWTSTIYKSPSGIRLKKSFCLSSTFSMQNAFVPELKISSKEESMVLPNSRCFAGA